MVLVQLQVADGSTISAELRQVEYNVSTRVVYREFDTAELKSLELFWSAENKIFEGTVDGQAVTLAGTYNSMDSIEILNRISRPTYGRPGA